MKRLTLKQKLVVLSTAIIATLLVGVVTGNKVEVAEIASGLIQEVEILEEVKFEYAPLYVNVCDSELTDSRPKTTFTLTDAEMELLYKIVWAEAGNEPFEGQVAVATTLLNRVEASTHPNTLKEVVYEGDGSQFNGIRRDNFGYYTEETERAVAEAIANPMFDKSVVYFANIDIATNRGFINRVIIPNKVTRIKGHTFAYDSRLKDEKGE